MFKVKGSVVKTARFGPGQFQTEGSYKWTWPLEPVTSWQIEDLSCSLSWKSPEAFANPKVAAWEAETKQTWAEDFTQAKYQRMKQGGH
jgi:hypothetical protein